MRRLFLLVTLLAGCASTASPTVPRTGGSPTKPAPIEKPSVAQRRAALNTQARRGAVVEHLHGERVEDPYRSLEALTPETQAWIDAQTARTARHLEPLQNDAMEKRLAQLLGIGSIGSIAMAAKRVFFILREGEREQPALYLIDQGKLKSEPLIDPQDYGERAAIDWFYPSKDGRRLAFGISDNGDERSVLRVLDVDTGELHADRIDHTKWCSLAWLNDGSGFYYTRYPRRGEQRYDAAHEDAYFKRVFFHALGSDPAGDPLLFESEVGTDSPAAEVGDDDRFVVIHNYRGWTASDVLLFDRGRSRRKRRTTPKDPSELVPVVIGEDKQTSGTIHRGYLYLVTNLGAPRRRVVRVKPKQAQDRAQWQEIVPQGASTIEDWALTRSHVLVHRIADASSSLMQAPLEGGPGRELPLPTKGSIAGLSGSPDSEQAAVTFSSFFHPPTLYGFDTASGERLALKQVAHDLDLAGLRLAQQSVTSQDGTAINVYYVYRDPLQRNRDNPVLLYGYGGFNIPQLPQFTRTALHWIERGGVYAVANLRGGGEGGEEFHRAGMLENKERVFEDFEAAIQWFTDSEISRPERIAITGGSNGGLLMGAMLTRVPERFAATASYVGLYDMLRYDRFPPAAIWASEYGDPADANAFKTLLAYSPYHRVREGVRFPNTLIETADHDTRVHFSHSAKFAARLQQASSHPEAIFFYMERKIGHGRGTRLSDLVRRYARRQAFLEWSLGGMPEP